jgi:hypothetical protein
MQNSQLNPWQFGGVNADVGVTLEDIPLTQGGQNTLIDLAQDATLETAAIPVRHRATLQVFMTNAGAAALTDFALLGKIHPTGDWVTLISGAGWNTLGNILIHRTTSTGNVSTLGAAATATAKIDVRGVWAVKFQASCGTTTAVIISGQLAAM